MPGRGLVIAAVASALVCAALAVAASTGSAAAPTTATCNKATGDALAERLPVGYYGERIGQTLCFDFTGDGRRDIVFTGWIYRTRGAHYWAAFRARGSTWSRATFKRDCCTARQASGIKILRLGRVIVVTQPIFAAKDKACCPSGGTRTGRWRWNGSALKLISTSTKPS